MYQGYQKGDGGIVGLVADDENDDGDNNGEFTFESTRAEESIVCNAFDEHGNVVPLVFASRLDSSSGEVEWVKGDEFALKKRTVEMSQMTSMLRDCDRNSIYETAISRCISNYIDQIGKRPIVLDIGAGTGLLSLLSMRYGARAAVACEMFDAMAEICGSVITENGFDDSVTVFPLKSTSLSLEKNEVNIIVSELLDSALLGESVLFSHAHAIERLMKPNAVIPLSQCVIPHSADVMASLIESDIVNSMWNVQGLNYGGCNVFRDELASDCKGGWPLLPVHWESLTRRKAKVLSQPYKILDINLYAETSLALLKGSNTSTTTAIAHTAGTVHGLLLWWKLFLLDPSLDPDRTCYYSTEPGTMNWQDHWVQCVYPLPEPVQCEVGDFFKIVCSHDMVHIRIHSVSKCAIAANSFEIIKDTTRIIKRAKVSDKGNSDDKSCEQLDDNVDDEFESQCTCGWHALCGAERMLMLSDASRKIQWENAVARIVHSVMMSSVSSRRSKSTLSLILDVSDGSLLAMAAALQVSNELLTSVSAPVDVKVVSKEKKIFSRILHSQVASANNLDDVLMVWDGQNWDDVVDYWNDSDEMDPNGANSDIIPSISALICEVFFYQLSALPTWQAISFMYQRVSLQQRMNDNVIICPCKAFIMAAVIQLENLNTSHGLVNTVSGFPHSAYDKAQEGWHTHMFPYKLGQYDKVFLIEPVCLAELDYKNAENAAARTSQTLKPITRPGRADCVAVWVDYKLWEAKQPNDTSDSGDQDIFIYNLDNWSVPDDPDFPLHVAVNLKFFEAPCHVSIDSTFVAECTFTEGDSDFQFAFGFR